jgi:protein Tex
VVVTVTEIDLPRQRIALSRRSKPEIGPKTTGGAGGGPRTSPGQRPGGFSGPRPGAAPAAPKPPQSLTGDWFSAAINKKK